MSNVYHVIKWLRPFGRPGEFTNEKQGNEKIFMAFDLIKIPEATVIDD